MLLAACATPGGEAGKPLAAPYLHPTARLVFPERVADLEIVDVHEFGPLDVAANYQASGVRLTVYVYPADKLLDSSIEAHFQQALLAVQHEWGTETAERLEFQQSGYDPRLPALAAAFEMEGAPLPLGVLSVHKACSHIVKLRLSSERTVTVDRRLAILDEALDAVLPRDFALKALQSLGGAVCRTEFVVTTDPSHVSADGCTVFGNRESGPEGVQKALCDALDAKVAAQPR